MPPQVSESNIQRRKAASPQAGPAAFRRFWTCRECSAVLGEVVGDQARVKSGPERSNLAPGSERFCRSCRSWQTWEG